MLSDFPFSDLHNWYKQNGRHDLPWRDYSFDKKTLGYRVWLAEIMLQQTQVERVKIYFENILEVFPTIEDLARCSYEEFFPYYKGLGYYSRARNMLKTAQRVIDDFGGIFPESEIHLQTLPGVGPYTAQAIRAFTYNIPTLSFDTNLEKIFSRYYFGNKFQKLSKEEKVGLLGQMKDFCNAQIQTLSQPLPLQGKGAGTARDINNALMDFGATISLNNISGIDWDIYPLTSSKFYKTQGKLEPIKEKKSSNFSTKQAYVIAILHENHKVYFGDNSKFTPFSVGENTGNPRAMIQQYFLSKYGLELSVRPPEIKSYNSREVPYLVCYCQIQSGTHSFKRFEGLKVRGFEEGLVERIDF